MSAGIAIAAVPSASAEQCVVTVTLLGGVQLPFTIDVPPGTPLSSLSLPGLKLPILSESESCPPAAAAPTTAPAVQAPSGAPTASAPTTRSTPTSQSPSASAGTKPKRTKSSKGAKNALSGAVQGSVVVKSATPQSPAAVKNGQAPLRTSTGAPTAGNPTFSFALPTPAPLFVPNFFIDSFQIPPGLLPIYQAAGIQYNVPWAVLAAINDVETNYGRNLSISSAGATGWMQFIPSTWKQYGMDITGSGSADPYNPVDAIFAAARYLNAAGASKNLAKAIFAYNHANWYVQSVLLRAKLIEGIPEQLIGALSGLVEGHFPVAAPATYADDAVESLATRRAHGANAALPINSGSATSISVFAKAGSPLIAVNDGKIVAMGNNRSMGRYLQLQDTNGNTYTYAHLGSISKTFAVPKPVKVTAKEIASELSAKPAPRPTGPATAGTQVAAAAVKPSTITSAAAKTAQVKATVAPKSSPSTRVSTPQPSGSPKVRLFANPSRPASYASGGQTQLSTAAGAIQSFQNYFSDTLHLARNQYTLQPLKVGSTVVAGTVLARIGAGSPTDASHLVFMIRPAGRDAPLIDPKVILDGWELLQASSIYRAANINPFIGPDAKNPTIGQVLLMSKAQLQQVVLADPHIQIYSCGRRDITAGLVDRRILGTMEFLSRSGLDPSISGLQCGQNGSNRSTPGANSVSTGASVEIAKINGVAIQGHQGTGSITDLTIRRLLTLQGSLRPNQIISLMSYPGQTNTLALPDHADRIQVAFTPLFGQNKKLSKQVNSILKPAQWIKLIDTISTIPQPTIPTTTVNRSSGH
ncbi:MAG: lytic murein transglycosylase [Actinomycetota bacterium]|nr:lytic murein transglycosylase [Actinomycetota bacterium]